MRECHFVLRAQLAAGKCFWYAAATAILLLNSACSRQEKVEAAYTPVKPAGQPVDLRPPLGLPAVPVPTDNPPTAETIALGRKLFYDKRLSGDNSIACQTCHDVAFGFSDGRKVSMGFGAQSGDRNAPSVWNSAYAREQFWDGRSPSLEAQVAGPMSNPKEMNHSPADCVHKLEADPVYREMFTKAFGPGPITLGKMEQAIASFERTVVSGNSPFDRYQFGGDKKAMSPAAVRGMEVFTDKERGNCIACHSVGETYALFTDNKYHNIGVGVNGSGELTDLGRYQVTHDEKDKGKFRTPSLRNIAQTAPYMHDGSVKTLKEVVDFYAGGGNSNPYLDPEIKKIQLTGQERADLVEFLYSLTGEIPADVGPPEAK